jgi:hypothetical protein
MHIQLKIRMCIPIREKRQPRPQGEACPTSALFRRLRKNAYKRERSAFMNKEICEAGQEAIGELGLTHEESQLKNLALYIYLLEQENSALRQRVELLSPMRKREPVAA